MNTQRVIMIDKRDRLQIKIMRLFCLIAYTTSIIYLTYVIGFSDGIRDIKNKIAGNSAFLCDIAEDKPNYPITRGYCIGIDSFNNLSIDK